MLAGLIGLTALIVAAMALSVAARDTPPAFIGTDMGGDPAPNFALANQFGDKIKLSEQRGKVVVLTFLYTHCPDVCPLTAARLRQVHAQLGADAADVTFLAVSVDPEGDTALAATEFSERFGMLERWSYLIGTREELEPIWKAYYVGVLPDTDHAEHADQVMHNAPIYLIDRDGRRRVVHTTGGATDAIIDEVLHDIRQLLDT